MKAITLLERPDDTLVFVTGDSAIISAFSLESHDLVDLWSVKSKYFLILSLPYIAWRKYHSDRYCLFRRWKQCVCNGHNNWENSPQI